MHNSVFKEHINLTYGRGFNAHLYGSVRGSISNQQTKLMYCN